MSAHPRPRFRPTVEALEGRCLPSSAPIPCGQVATVQIGLLVNDQGAPLSAGQQIDAHTHFNAMPNLVLNPGSSVQFAAELLDAKGNVLGFGRSQDLSPQGIKLQFGYANFAQLRNQVSRKMQKNMLKQLHISPGPGALRRLERRFARLDAEVATLNADTGALVPLPGKNELSVGAMVAAQDFSGKACGTASRPTLVTRPSNKHRHVGGQSVPSSPQAPSPSSALYPYDGSYSGQYDGTVQLADGSMRQVSGTVGFTVTHNLVTVSAPFPTAPNGDNGVLAGGFINFQCQGSDPAQGGAEIGFQGQLVLSNGKVLVQNGTWDGEPIGNFATGQGTWTLS